MPLIFYPPEDDFESSSIQEQLDTLLAAAEQYKAVVLETAPQQTPDNGSKKGFVPRDMKVSYNWQAIAKLLHTIRELPEASAANKLAKADYLTKLAGIYEILRGAKMAKLEAVRLALLNEAAQLKSASQVA